MTAYLILDEAVDSQTGRRRIAYDWLAGSGPPVMFLPGFASNMQGSKATALAEYCRREGRALLRFDYGGHGLSDGTFTDGTIGAWLADALAVFDHVIREPALLVGSSMGGWLMLHVARARPTLVAGLVGLASAPDFIDRLRPRLSEAQRGELRRQGQTALPSLYGEPLILTAKLADEATNHNLLDQDIELRCPCHLIHGQQDPDVPWSVSLDLAARITSPHVTVELIKDGDHRLSRPADLRRMLAAIERLRDLYHASDPTS